MAVTIKDVAKMAGVSISTVSRVINDSKPVSPDAKRRVLNAIDVLNYEPNEIARSLVTRKSNIIGVIVEDFGLSFVSQAMRGVEEVARMYDYDIIVSSTYGDPVMEDRYIKLMLQKQVEGIVVITESNNKNRVKNIKSLKIPVSYLNRYYRNEDVFTFSIDNTEATKALTKYIIDKGHKNILYLGIEEDFNITVERFKQPGYKEAMTEAGLEPKIVMLSENSPEAFMDISNEIIEKIKAENITAIMAYSDEAAIRLINILLDYGIRVPDEISVSGMGNITMSDLYRPKLTTIKDPFYDYGAVAIRTIIKTIKGEGTMPEKTMILPFYIIERESVRQI